MIRNEIWKSPTQRRSVLTHFPGNSAELVPKCRGSLMSNFARKKIVRFTSRLASYEPCHTGRHTLEILV